MDVLTVVEDRVRDGVRSRGIDPLKETDAVRELVAATVAGVLADWPLNDDSRQADSLVLSQHAVSAVAGFGPLQVYFDDPEVEELWINDRLTGWYWWTLAVGPWRIATASCRVQRSHPRTSHTQ